RLRAGRSVRGVAAAALRSGELPGLGSVHRAERRRAGTAGPLLRPAGGVPLRAAFRIGAVRVSTGPDTRKGPGGREPAGAFHKVGAMRRSPHGAGRNAAPKTARPPSREGRAPDAVFREGDEWSPGDTFYRIVQGVQRGRPGRYSEAPEIFSGPRPEGPYGGPARRGGAAPGPGSRRRCCPRGRGFPARGRRGRRRAGPTLPPRGTPAAGRPAPTPGPAARVRPAPTGRAPGR